MTQETRPRAGRKTEQAQGELFTVPETSPPSPAPAPRKRARTPAKQRVKRRGRKPKPPALKMVRESFTLPPQEQETLHALQLALRKRGRYEVTRSLILRAGIARLAQLPASELQRAVEAVEKGAASRA